MVDRKPVVLLSRGDMAELTGASSYQLDYLVKRGALKAYGSGQGRGHHNLYTVNQVLGLAVAMQVERTTPWSCSTDGFDAIIHAFRSWPSPDLDRRIPIETPCLGSLHEGRPFLVPRKVYYQVDVHKIWQSIKAHITLIQQRPRKGPHGRLRALQEDPS